MPATGLSLVEIRGFAKAYGAAQVFAEVELDVAQGEMCILLGLSGCGKTTLLRAIAGLVRPDAGRIVQAGPAREAYDRPATRFVAGFMGNFNLLEPDAVLRVFNERSMSAWAIHPEAFDVLPAPPLAGEDGLWVEAAATDLRIHGPVLRYMVLANGTELKVDALNRSSVPERRRGERVWLRLDRGQAREIV